VTSVQSEATGILTDDMKRVVREQRLAFVATICPDGTPNLSPKGTTRVWGNEQLVFCDLRSPQTVENLRSNPVLEVTWSIPLAAGDIGSKGRQRSWRTESCSRRFLPFMKAAIRR
jgi:uncharacterized protein